MSNNVYFEDVIGIGDLFLEYIFFEFESEPILFTCVDREKNLYLCLCSEIRYGQKWLITKCNMNTLRAVIEERIDVASAFFRNPFVVSICMDLQGVEESYIIEKSKIDELDLPKPGTYIKCNREKAQGYLWNKEAEELHQKRKCNEIDIANESFNMSSKQKVNYRTTVNKNKIDCLNMIDSTQKQYLVIHEYFMETKEKYDEIMDNINLGSGENDNYLGAA